MTLPRAVVLASLFIVGCGGTTRPAESSPEPPVATASEASPPPSVEVPTSAVTSASPLATAPPPIPPNTLVLLLGDSMVHAGFAKALGPHVKALGARYEVRGEQSTFTSTWAGRMELLIANNQPDLVIISLGSNELQVPTPETHAAWVKRMVKFIGKRPCVWVTPPMWTRETGMIDVIQKNAAPCRFFETDKHIKAPLARQKDGVHPNEVGGAAWAEAFWAWLEQERTGEGAPWAMRQAPPGEYAPEGPRDVPKFDPLPAEVAGTKASY